MILGIDEATEPEGVTVAGAKELDVHEGNPEHDKVASSTNPLCGVTRTVAVPLLSAVTVSDAGKAPTEMLENAASWPIV